MEKRFSTTASDRCFLECRPRKKRGKASPHARSSSLRLLSWPKEPPELFGEPFFIAFSHLRKLRISGLLPPERFLASNWGVGFSKSRRCKMNPSQSKCAQTIGHYRWLAGVARKTAASESGRIFGKDGEDGAKSDAPAANQPRACHVPRSEEKKKLCRFRIVSRTRRLEVPL